MTDNPEHMQMQISEATIAEMRPDTMQISEATIAEMTMTTITEKTNADK
jgi:hypothetical protein